MSEEGFKGDHHVPNQLIKDYQSKYESRRIPMFDFQDYGNDGLDYFCTLPYKRWGAYFKNRLSN